MITMMYECCAPTYPFACLYGCVCGFPPLQWSSTLLMWADVGTLDSGKKFHYLLLSFCTRIYVVIDTFCLG